MSFLKSSILYLGIFTNLTLIVCRAQVENKTNICEFGLIKYKLSNISDSVYLKNDILYRMKKDKLFFLIDSSDVILQTSFMSISEEADYKVFALSLKYYSDKTLKIHYQPSLFKQNLLSKDEGYLDELSRLNHKRYLFEEPFNLRKAGEKMFVSNPEIVSHVWSEIPEPHRLITDRTYLRNRSAEEGIANLLDYENYETKKKLEKRVRKTGPWVVGGTENLQLSQTYLSNWTKGGESTIALQSDLILTANYIKNKIEWENYIRHKLGIVSSDVDPAQINTDQIEFFNKYGIKASKKWYYSIVSNFKSQLFNAYQSKEKVEVVSTFLSPAYITFSLGMDYKANENFTLLISPISAKFTYVMDTVKVDQTRYEIDADKKSAFNKGLAVLNTYTWDISTEFKLISHLDAFIGYETKRDFYQVDWELIFDMRINKYLSTRINTQLRYFTNESTKLQFREYFAVSFNYKF